MLFSYWIIKRHAAAPYTNQFPLTLIAAQSPDRVIINLYVQVYLSHMPILSYTCINQVIYVASCVWEGRYTMSLRRAKPIR